MRASAANRSIFARLVLAVAGVVMTSCALATAPPRIVKGKEFPQDKAESIHEGMSAQEVRDLVGEPLEVQAVGAESRWRYYERERQDEKIYILGLIPVAKPYWIVDAELIIILQNDIVKEVLFQETQVR